MKRPPVSDYVFQSDVNTSGQLVYRFFDPDTHLVHVKSALTWNLPQEGSLPTRELFSFPGAPPEPLEVTSGIAIAKATTEFALFKSDTSGEASATSVVASWVGSPYRTTVARSGDRLGARTITQLQVSERNFIDNAGRVTFEAQLDNETWSIVLATPVPWLSPTAAQVFEITRCLLCRLSINPGAPGVGMDTPAFLSLSARGTLLSFRAEPGLNVTCLILPVITTDSHNPDAARLRVHFEVVTEGEARRRTFEIEPNTIFDFTEFVPGGINSFLLDGFTGLDSPGLVLGLTFSDEPAGRFLQVLVDAVEVVSIDVKPGGALNAINPRSHGKIPVAILSGPGFDAPRQVDISSLRFGRTGYEPSLGFCNRQGEDVDSDGYPDLVCHFTTELTGFLPTDTRGVLRGQTVEGLLFAGEDAVRLVQ